MPSLAVISYRKVFLTNAFFLGGRCLLKNVSLCYLPGDDLNLKVVSIGYWKPHSVESGKTGYRFACCLPLLDFSGGAVVKKLPASAGD